MDVTETVRSYYADLRAGDPLAPYFSGRGTVVKFGVSERLSGPDAVAAGLREQTETTTDWTVESHRLVADRRGDVGWFTDDVTLAWTEAGTGTRHAFETRWSATLERDGRWRFVTMHVSAPHDLSSPDPG